MKLLLEDLPFFPSLSIQQAGLARRGTGVVYTIQSCLSSQLQPFFNVTQGSCFAK